MAEVTSELMLELLRKIHHRMDGLEGTLGEIKQELVSIRLTQLGTQNDIHNIYGILARHDERFDRIERRLELRELAERPQSPYTPA